VIDSSFYTADLLVHAGQGINQIHLGVGNDTVEFDSTTQTALLSSNDQIDGGGNTGAEHNRLLFNGSAIVNDVDFTNVTHMSEIDLKQGNFTVTLGAHSDAAGITTVDASDAANTVMIHGGASSNNLTLHGSAASDSLEGGSGSDHLIGGGGQDFLFGNGGSDVFVYESAADSRQLPGNVLNYMDIIQDFTSGDHLDIDKLVGGPVTGVTDLGTVGAFATTDTTNFFNGNAVAVATDGNNTRVYVDANHDGSFNLAHDLVVQVTGVHVNDLNNVTGYV